MEEIQQIAIDMDDDDLPRSREYEQLAKISQGLNELSGDHQREKTIFRLSNNHDRDLCDPRVVSIGPYHRGKRSLQTMENNKWLSLRSFLKKSEVDLQLYLEGLNSIEEQTRQCYSESVEMSSEEFGMMLLLDGCFILEWLSSNCTGKSFSDLDIFYDMCMIENQVPFFVLEMLWRIRYTGDEAMGRPDHLVNLINEVFEAYSRDVQSLKFNPIVARGRPVWHLLDLYYMGVASEFESSMEVSQSRANVDRSDLKDIHITCVSELCDAGIQFKKKKGDHVHMLDISFAPNGTIEMPFLQIDGRFVRMLWNLVALEQQIGIGGDSLQPLSSYLALMDSLIDTEKDIPILERAGIIDNYFSNAYEAAYYFNQFSKAFRLNYHHHYFYGFFRDVRKYSESTWPKYRARLIKDYFSNPWAIISVGAAAALFGLTILQTYYSAQSV